MGYRQNQGPGCLDIIRYAVSIKANYSEKLLKVKNSLSCWEYRRLTLLGKIVVLKSLIVSQPVHIL